MKKILLYFFMNIFSCMIVCNTSCSKNINNEIQSTDEIYKNVVNLLKKNSFNEVNKILNDLFISKNNQ